MSSGAPSPLEALRRFLARTAAMAEKETLHVRRDIRTLYLVLGMPVVMLFLFGYGLSFDINHLPIAVADADRSETSQNLVQALLRSDEFEGTNLYSSPEQLEREFREGRAVAGLVIPKGFEARLLEGKDATVQLVVDGADAVVSQQVMSKADLIVRDFGKTLLPEALKSIRAPLSVKLWTRYNPAAKSAMFMVPGLAAYLLAISAVLLTALTVAGEWERGSMEQLFASPVGRLEIVVGKLLPYLALGMLELLLVLAFGAVAFDLPFRGSFFALMSMGFFFLVAMLGQGLLISVVTKNQLVATQAGALSALLPSMLLSGMMVPIENMPRILQWLSYIVPARYMVHGLRGILLKGNDLSVLLPDFLAQIAFAVVILVLTTVRFQRRLA